MNVVKIIFSYDRPLQLWGLVRSIVDNADLRSEDIVCICKSTSERARRGYDVVSSELGCRILHEPVKPGGIRGLFWRKSLYDLVLAQSNTADFVSLAVDDMMYFNKACFAEACDLLARDPDVCLWSWRAGVDLQPHESLTHRSDHWRADRFTTPLPYRYVFHTDGSLFRREDFGYWMGLLSLRKRRRMNLNKIEGYLARYSRPGHMRRLRLGGAHAGPLAQSCVTWQVNKVSDSGGALYSDVEDTATERLIERFENGDRLFYERFYGRTDWFEEAGDTGGAPRTHVPPTNEALALWLSCVRGA